MFHRDEKFLRNTTLQPFFNFAKTNKDPGTTRILTYAEARLDQISARYNEALNKFEMLVDNRTLPSSPITPND